MAERTPTTEDEAGAESLTALLRPIWRQRSLIVLAALVAAGIAVLASLVHYWSQPSRWTAHLEFSPMFMGAGAGKYPNGLAFGPSDIIDTSILDQVYDANKVQDFCPRDDFRSAFFIEQRSSELEVIDFDYQARLADTRLSAVERQRMLDEYQARRAAAKVQYGITFTRPVACAKLPQPLALKFLDDVLIRWANDSEFKRGVLKQRVRVLTPYVFDLGASAHSLFIRANLVWTNLDRVIRNVNDVGEMPGAQLVRFGQQQVSLPEVKARLTDLQRAELEPLIASSGSGGDKESIRWVEETLASANSELQRARSRAQANVDALREYSGVPAQTAASKGESTRTAASGDIQSLTPQIDRTFIDRIVDMSSPNILFRQELTRQVVTSSLQATEYESTVDHYRQLLAAIKDGPAASSTGGFGDRLKEITNEAKELTNLFDGIYDEWSRVSLRAGPAMYRTEQSATVSVIRPYSITSYVRVVVLVFLFALILATLIVLVKSRIAPSLSTRGGRP